MAESGLVAKEPLADSPKQAWLRDFVGYLIVGGLAFLVDFGLYFTLIRCNLDVFVAAPISFLVGLMVNYGLAVRFVFHDHRLANRSVEFLFYGVIGLAGLCINQVVIWIGVNGLNLGALEFKIVATGVVFLFNFVVRRTLLFSKARHD